MWKEKKEKVEDDWTKADYTEMTADHLKLKKKWRKTILTLIYG